ncbi:general substrate transporter [Kalaharituber pfeilii]|nr:general substrate transporter [Kalaharituber pfeilii]
MFKLYFFLLVAFLNNLINAYAGTLVGIVWSMKEFHEYFHLNDEAVGSDVGLLMSSYAIGNIVGSFFCGPFTDWWGRRWGMFSGAVFVIVAAIVQGSSKSLEMFIGGRIIMGFGIALLNTAGPCYVAEMAHPAWRGPITGLYNAIWGLGSVPALLSPHFVKNLPGHLSWRLPLWFQALGGGLLLISCMFIPESPRWLYANDLKEESVRVLEKYHGEGSRKSPIVVLTYREMVQEVFIEGSDKRWWDYSDLFNSKTAWWRNTCIIGIAFCSQWCGNGTTTYFQAMLQQQAGIVTKGAINITTYLFIVLSLGSALIGAFMVDRIGRRGVLLLGNSLMIFWWTVIAILCALYAREENGNEHGARAAIAFITIFGMTYSFSYTPLQVLYPVECLAYETRAKGMGFYNLCVHIAGFFNAYGIPTIMEKIQWRFYFIYVGWNFCQVAWIYFFFVETRGRSLEEINEIFKAPYPKNKSLEEHVFVLSEQVLAKSWELNDLKEFNTRGSAPSTSTQPL